MEKSVISNTTKKIMASRAEKSAKSAKYTRGFTITQTEIAKAVYVAAGFFIGRVIAFDYMNPAVTAYLAVFLGQAGLFYLTALAALLGLMTNLTSVSLIEYLSAIALLGASNYFLEQNKIAATDTRKALIGAACVLTGGGLAALVGGANVYLLIIAAVEAVVTLSLCYIFMASHKTLESLIGGTKTGVLSNEQLISVSALLGISFAGMAGISISGVYLRDILSLCAVLLFSYAGGAGAGAASGVIFSIVMVAGASYSASYTGILSIAGILGGVFYDFKKAGSFAAFAAGLTVAAVYLDRASVSREFFITIGASGALFFLIPSGVTEAASHCFAKDNALENEEYIEKVKSLANERLKGFSESFKLLSSTLSSLSEKKEVASRHDISRLIDKIAQNACKGCMNFDSCWKDGFYDTYQSIFVLLATSDKKGYIATKDIPDSLKTKCIDILNFAEVTNRVFLVYKTDLKWRGKLVESRELVSQQLGGVSEIMAELSKELELLTSFNEKYEKIIREQLEKQRIGVDSLIVLENKQGRYEVSLTARHGADMRSGGKKITDTISDILGRKMVRESSSAVNVIGAAGVAQSQKKQGFKLTLQEARRFNVTTGVSRAAKNTVSGDNHTWLELKNGRMIVALSDGMGTGNAANDESRAAIELLEQFLDTGFSKELAIKMINSVLVLKSDEDFFTTLDLMCIDLYSGACEIVKIGAVETFLLRDNKVRVIKQSGLPVGIVSDLEIETSAVNLKDGDILLLVTDGITDAGRPAADTRWPVDALTEYDSYNPQYIADFIIEKAKAMSGGRIKDDMTALALRVWTK